LQEKTLEDRYGDLLKVIGDIGKDVKPAYTNNKMSADRLKRSEKIIILSFLDEGMCGLCPLR